MEEPIRAVIRVKPEPYAQQQSIINLLSDDTLQVIGNANFTFDKIIYPEASQKDVFELVGVPLCEHALEGFNVTLFCYGQTGTGKTWTMQGPTGIDGMIPNKQERGLVQRTFEYIIDKQTSISGIEMSDEESTITYLNKISSYVEIYNEQIFDLLDPTTPACALREDIKKGYYVSGATEWVIESAEDAQSLLEIGARHRKTASTDMNRCSSRSHSILTLLIQTKIRKNGITKLTESRFNLVDLAGSERQKAAKTEGARLKEGSYINKSLLTLGNCINALADISDGKAKFVHYRDSKLTLLLKDSLGGNSKATMIANISNTHNSLLETMGTLKFASRAKLVKNRSQINQSLEEADLYMLREEVNRLTLENQILSSQQGSGGFDQQYSQTFESEILSVISNHAEESENKLAKAAEVIASLQETVNRREKQLQSTKMRLRLKDEQLLRLKNSTKTMGKSDSKLDLAESCEEDYEKQKLREEIQILKASLENQSPEVVQYATQVIQLQDQLDSLSQYQSIIDNSQAQEDKLIKMAKQASEKILEYCSERETLKQEILSLKNNEYVVKLQQEIAVLNSKLEQTEDEKGVLLNDLQNFENEAMAEKELLSQKILDQEQVAEEHEKQLILAQQEIDALKRDHSSISQENELLKESQAKVVELSATVRELEQEKKHFERMEQKARRISDFANSKEIALQETVNELKTRAQELQSVITIKDEQISQAEETAARFINQLEESKDEINSLVIEMQEMTKTHHDLITHNKALTNDCETFQGTINALNAQITNLEKNYQVVTQEKIYIEHSLHSALSSKSQEENVNLKFIQSTFEEYKQSMERTVQDNLLVIENLKSRVEKDKGKLTEYENNLLEYQDIEKENSEMREILSKTQESSTKIQNDYELLQQEVISNKEIIDKLSNDIIILQASLSEIKEVIIVDEELNKKYEKMRMDYSMLEDDFTDLTNARTEDLKVIEQLKKSSRKQAKCKVASIQTEVVEEEAPKDLDEVYEELKSLSHQLEMQRIETAKYKAENEKLVKHSNHKQKLQYMVQLKRENNTLKAELREKKYLIDQKNREDAAVGTYFTPKKKILQTPSSKQ